MEAARARQKRSGHTLDDDPRMRTARPGAPSSASQRKMFHGNAVPSKTQFIGANPKLKSAKPVNPESDDEIDSLHGSSAADSDDEERMRITRLGPKKRT